MRLQQTRVPGQKRRPPLPQPTAQILMLDSQDLAIVWVRTLITKWVKFEQLITCTAKPYDKGGTI